jgi:hypothetical protein
MSLSALNGNAAAVASGLLWGKIGPRSDATRGPLMTHVGLSLEDSRPIGSRQFVWFYSLMPARN